MGTAHSNSRSHNKELSQTLRILLADSKYCAMRDQRAQLSRGVKLVFRVANHKTATAWCYPHNYPSGSRLASRETNQKTAIAWCYPHNYPMGSRLASRATNQKIAIAWCDPLAGKEILCIQLSWIGHPIFKAILLFRCSIFFCWLAGRISCYVKVKPLPICNLAPFFLSCFLDNELT